MLKKILVPIDATHVAAGSQSIAMAQKVRDEDGHLILLNVLENVPAYVASQIPESVLAKVAAEAEAELKRISADHNLPETTEVLVKRGKPSTTILNVARETGADAIVVASHDPGIADYFLGSVAAYVVRHAHCSVFVVRDVKA
jgi:nucleotide-binding universal stress UspA family protein